MHFTSLHSKCNRYRYIIQTSNKAKKYFIDAKKASNFDISSKCQF